MAHDEKQAVSKGLIFGGGCCKKGPIPVTFFVPVPDEKFSKFQDARDFAEQQSLGVLTKPYHTHQEAHLAAWYYICDQQECMADLWDWLILAKNKF